MPAEQQIQFAYAVGEDVWLYPDRCEVYCIDRPCRAPSLDVPRTVGLIVGREDRMGVPRYLVRFAYCSQTTFLALAGEDAIEGTA